MLSAPFLRSQDARTLAAFLLAVLLIGSNLVAIRYTNREIDPFWGAGARFAIAALLFYLALKLNRRPLPRGRALTGGLLYGAIGIGLYFALVYWGLVEVKAGYGQVLLSLAPLLTLFLAIGQGQEVFRWRGLLGGLVALTGIAVIFREQIEADVPFLSVFVLVLAAACAAQGGIVLKRFPPVDLFATNAVAMATGAGMLLLLSLAAGESQALPAGATTSGAFAYLATVGTLGTFLLYMYVLKQWTASASAYQWVLAPIVAVALAGLLLNEGVSAGFFAGGGLVLAGVYTGVLMPDRARPRAATGVDGQASG